MLPAKHDPSDGGPGRSNLPSPMEPASSRPRSWWVSGQGPTSTPMQNSLTACGVLPVRQYWLWGPSFSQLNLSSQSLLTHPLINRIQQKPSLVRLLSPGGSYICSPWLKQNYSERVSIRQVHPAWRKAKSLAWTMGGPEQSRPQLTWKGNRPQSERRRNEFCQQPEGLEEHPEPRRTTALRSTDSRLVRPSAENPAGRAWTSEAATLCRFKRLSLR